MPRALGSKIILCRNIKMDREYNNVIDYTEQQMVELCQANKIVDNLGYSYIRHQNVIQTNFSINQCLQANYIAFQNPDYSNKWFFAFIDDVKFIGDNNTEISYTIDAWSTFFKNLTLRQCMVVREHINAVEDIEGTNTVPENLDLGDEYKVNAHLRDSFNREIPSGGRTAYYIVVASTKDLGTLENVGGAIYNGIPTGVRYFYYGINPNPLEGESPVQGFIDAINRLASSTVGGSNPLDAIQSVFIAPFWLLKNGTSWYIPESISPNIKHTGISKITALDGYTPKNKKLLTYPYCYILVSNAQGSDAILKQELWQPTESDVSNGDGYPSVSAGELMLNICGALTPGCSIRAVPVNYNGDNNPTNYGINLGKFPQINWNSDAYINWLTSNGVNIGMAVAGTLLGTAVGSVEVTSTSIVKGIDLMKQGIQASMSPPQNHGNTNNGDIMLSLDENCFHIFRMTIKREYAERIDNYFTKYGYKTNKLKIPNVTGRPVFNYIQIAGDDEIGFGSVPSKYFDIINKICRNGVTIWHNHNNVGNYNLDNR